MTFAKRFTLIDGATPELDGAWTQAELDADQIKVEHIWTVLDADGTLYIVPGHHYVNRMGYYVTEQAWEESDLEDEYRW